MKPTDRELGLNRPTSRRDLLHGVVALAASTLVPGRALADEILTLEQAGETSSVYPPALTGWRGNHVGSFETAGATGGRVGGYAKVMSQVFIDVE